MTENRHIGRMILVAVLVTAVIGGLGARLAFLHLGPNEELRANVLRKRQKQDRIITRRGRILDCKGEILAMDLAARDVVANPHEILKAGHLRFITTHLARILQLDPAVVTARLNRPGRKFEYIARFVHTDVAEQLSRLKLTGIRFEETSKRHYPHGALMSHVVGFSNVEGVGSAGIEQRLNNYLRGSPGLRVSDKDAIGREIYSRRILEIPPHEGLDVYLTLDMTIQYLVETALDAAIEKYAAKGAYAIVQDIRTGAILAMASRPDFDLNQYRFTKPEERRNGAIGCVYEPGSTFKVAVVAAALNEGLMTPDDMVDCENGIWYYQGRSLRDYSKHGVLSVADVLKESSNIGAAKVALEVGEERLERYLRSFGVGSKTGINLPGEEDGILYPHSTWSAISITRIAMGHEVAVTALQMLNIISAIANDGFLMRPLIVNRVTDSQGRTVFEAQPEVMARPITESTARTVRELLVRVTEEGGTGAKAALEDYTVGGKTGTAQKPIPGGYSDTANMASFVGFLPAEDPELAIIVVMDEPYPLRTGGAVAAPVFREIAEQVMRYRKSRPENLTSRRPIVFPELI